MKKINSLLLYGLSVHLLALLFMTSQRLVLLLTNLQQLSTVTHKFSWCCSALLRGLWFDNVIACYITSVTLLFLTIFGLLNIKNRRVFLGFNIFLGTTFSIVFGVGVANIPYFNYFFKHLNTSIFNWAEEKGVAMNMILQEKSYYIYFLFFLLSVALFIYLIRRISFYFLQKESDNIRRWDYLRYALICLVLIGGSIFGIRGRTGYNPISSSQAYFCDNSFLNQLGINPLFYFVRDVIETSESHVSADALIAEQKAIEVARRELGMENVDYVESPLKREVIAQGKPGNQNVVVVLMESMSADLLSVREKGKEITPFLNSLINKSYYFDQFYSSGNHTNHGIIASLFGMPSLFDRNIMKNVQVPHCQGLPNTLQSQQYHTLFFMSHEGQYDNMKAFLTENGVDEIYAQEDYPSVQRVNSFGVADGFLLNFAFDKINSSAAKGKPFQATVLTISNHPPYIVPDSFKQISSDPQYQIVAYADHCLKTFMDKAAQTKWFQNTIFVFLADHGKIVGSSSYDMPLSYNHIPLIIYSPTFKDAPRKFSNPAGQVDVFPTLMGMLNRSYTNNTFGIDLLKQSRKRICFSSDNSMGCVTGKYFYMYNFKTQMEGLYRFTSKDAQNYLNEHKSIADSLRQVSAAMIRTSGFMLDKHLMRLKKF